MAPVSAVGKSNCSIALHTMTRIPTRNFSRKDSGSPTSRGLRLQHPTGSGMQPAGEGEAVGGGALALDCGGAGGGGKGLTTGAGACVAVGFGIAKVSVWSPFCNVA